MGGTARRVCRQCSETEGDARRAHAGQQAQRAVAAGAGGLVGLHRLKVEQCHVDSFRRSRWSGFSVGTGVASRLLV
ncbi:hypothetical protein STRTUCAR8_09542, partial [Streptomyces turgidiscabies Car8]